MSLKRSIDKSLHNSIQDTKVPDDQRPISSKEKRQRLSSLTDTSSKTSTPCSHCSTPNSTSRPRAQNPCNMDGSVSDRQSPDKASPQKKRKAHKPFAELHDACRNNDAAKVAKELTRFTPYQLKEPCLHLLAYAIREHKNEVVEVLLHTEGISLTPHFLNPMSHSIQYANYSAFTKLLRFRQVRENVRMDDSLILLALRKKKLVFVYDLMHISRGGENQDTLFMDHPHQWTYKRNDGTFGNVINKMLKLSESTDKQMNVYIMRFVRAVIHRKRQELLPGSMIQRIMSQSEESIGVTKEFASSGLAHKITQQMDKSLQSFSTDTKVSLERNEQSQEQCDNLLFMNKVFSLLGVKKRSVAPSNTTTSKSTNL